LSEMVGELARRRAAFEAAEARLLAAWDRRRAWADDGARSPLIDRSASTTFGWPVFRASQAAPECGGRPVAGPE
ncbi:MAG: hypothetical protein M3Q68_07250, partial [Actinomycetota bacterium]|nr:hypothetical protein [Actinomycetota bacterium]